ncbi:L,D-transpeptidase [Nocardioides alcanivorans]|uniref:L,D-transpeptidase n=1 Tax=Nocardioides alcanivorans TaxID=2897352 RepID=UPI001F3D9AB9|nr:L,D-transpeptidase [Nocardioides alcanivorans]
MTTTLEVRFGSTSTPTREGTFSVDRMSRDHVSSLYDSEMPFAMFFSGGQAVHYSSDFAARGYNGASHGCVNVRDYEGIKWLFDQVRVGDKVIVYWS